MVFDLIAEAFGNILGVTPAIGGYLAGFILLIIFMIIGVVIADDWEFSIILGMASVVLSCLVGWFPIWILVFIVIFFMFMIVRPNASKESA